jgi:pimeloyl-ACP methyl ester carboxylesterase
MPEEIQSEAGISERSIRVNHVRLAYFERGQKFRGLRPTLLFVHATGFHARVWDRIIRDFPDHHVLAIDQRGHGRSEKQAIHHWEEVIADLTEFVRELALSNIVGIGHSMGAHAMLGAAARVEDRFLRIIAIDPVIPAESAYHTERKRSSEPHPIARRRREFDSPEAMAAALRPKGSFGVFEPDILMDYCRHGLLPRSSGEGYTLACPPEIEASVYQSARSNHGIYEAIHTLALPVLILRARLPAKDRQAMDFSSSPTWPGLVDEFRNAREIHFADRTHFLPMEIPAEISALIRQETQAAAGELLQDQPA